MCVSFYRFIDILLVKDTYLHITTQKRINVWYGLWVVLTTLYHADLRFQNHVRLEEKAKVAQVSQSVSLNGEKMRKEEK